MRKPLKVFLIAAAMAVAVQAVAATGPHIENSLADWWCGTEFRQQGNQYSDYCETR